MNQELLHRLNQSEIAFDTEGADIEEVERVVKAAFPDDTGYLPILQRDLLQYIVYWPKSEDFDRRLWIDRPDTKLPTFTIKDFLQET